MIIVDDLHKAYGEVKAIDSVSFSIQPGEIVGLLGLKTKSPFRAGTGRMKINYIDVLYQKHFGLSILDLGLKGPNFQDGMREGCIPLLP